MRNRITIFFFLAAGSLLLPRAGAPAAQNQNDQVVKAEALLAKSAVHAGDAFKTALLLKINPGWHINANEVTDEFLFASACTFEENDRFTVKEYVYPEARRGKYEYSENELLVYEGETAIGVLIEAAKSLAPGSYKIKGTFDYQACNQKSCLPPKTIDIEITVAVVPAGQETKDINREIFEKIKFKAG